MQLKKKIFIDRFIGRILVFLLIPIVKLLGYLMRFDHVVRPEKVRCIAVAKYFGLGSIIHTLPMLRALRNLYPSAKILFITHVKNKPIFAHIDGIDEVYFVDDHNLWRLVVSNVNMFFSLIANRIDLFFDLELFSAYGAIVSLASMGRNRFGFFCNSDTDFKNYIYTHLMYFNFTMPIRVCYLQLARMAHVAADSSSDLVPLSIDQELLLDARHQIQAILSGHVQQRRIAININASELSLERRWPAERFVHVAQYFSQRGYTIIFVGSSEERGYVQQVVEQTEGEKSGIYNIAGCFSFSIFLAILKECDLLITNDTGVMNMGYALLTPTLSLFGPCHPVQYHIDRANTHAIYGAIYCSPCIHHLYIPPCRGKQFCMLRIEVKQVIESAENILEQKHIMTWKPADVPLMVEESVPFGILRSHF
ncbi:MAG: glycosyltransferase family 9 protein [Magnetococcus sp. DMHC-6]